MVKKISKHSRAARRAESGFNELKELADLPRAEKTDITSSVIRTASRNEQLLNRKMAKNSNSNKVGKGSRAEINRAKLLKEKLQKADLGELEKDRIQKTLNLTNVLDGKISKSISKAKYVQSARKAGWDATNSRIKRELELVHTNFVVKTDGAEKQTTTEDKPADDEEHVMTFGEQEELEEQEKQLENEQPQNAFGALDNDVEA